MKRQRISWKTQRMTPLYWKNLICKKMMHPKKDASDSGDFDENPKGKKLNKKISTPKDAPTKMMCTECFSRKMAVKCRYKCCAKCCRLQEDTKCRHHVAYESKRARNSVEPIDITDDIWEYWPTPNTPQSTTTAPTLTFVNDDVEVHPVTTHHIGTNKHPTHKVNLDVEKSTESKVKQVQDKVMKEISEKSRKMTELIGKSTENDLENDLLVEQMKKEHAIDKFTCPVCKDEFVALVYSCRHMICLDCALTTSAKTMCPTCRRPGCPHLLITPL
jgi:hypothetical protein